MISLLQMTSNSIAMAFIPKYTQCRPQPRRIAIGSFGVFLAIAACSTRGHAQNASPTRGLLVPAGGAQPAPRGGSATAGVFAPVLDSERRPITAGGFVKDGPVIFKDIAQQAGLTTWKHNMGTLEKKYILET